MTVNRHLCVSFSNGVNWNGVMSVDCVQKRADQEYPDTNINILVSEILSTEEGTNVINHICLRDCGNWINLLSSKSALL